MGINLIIVLKLWSLVQIVQCMSGTPFPACMDVNQKCGALGCKEGKGIFNDSVPNALFCDLLQHRFLCSHTQGNILQRTFSVSTIHLLWQCAHIG